MAAHRAAPAGAETPGSAVHDPGLAPRVPVTRNAQAAVEKRLRRVRKMLDDVMNAVFHVGDAAQCELRAQGRTRGTRGGRHKDRRRAVEDNDGSSKTRAELPKEVKEWVAVVKPSKNMDKRRARQATARARKAEEENELWQKRLKLKESKVGTDEVTVRDCLRALETKELHEMELDDVLLILETRWRQAEERISNQKSRLESLEEERGRSAERQHALQKQLDAQAAATTAAVEAAAEKAAAEKAAAERAAERSAELQRALHEQLDAARRGLGEVPLLREQLQRAQQEAAQAATATAEADAETVAYACELNVARQGLEAQRVRNAELQHALHEQLEAARKAATEKAVAEAAAAKAAVEGAAAAAAAAATARAAEAAAERASRGAATALSSVLMLRKKTC